MNLGVKDGKWADGRRPVKDATAPELCGPKQNRIAFYTQSDLEDIYSGCHYKGFQVLGIKGTLIRGRISRYWEELKDKDGNPRPGTQNRSKPMVEEVKGTARIIDPDRAWKGAEELEGFYRVVVT